MSAAGRVRELARQMRNEVRSIVLAREAAFDASIDTHGEPGGERVQAVNEEALNALDRVVREVAAGPMAARIHPAIVAHGLAIGLTDLIPFPSSESPYFRAAIDLQCATAERLKRWAHQVEREGGVRDGY